MGKQLDNLTPPRRNLLFLPATDARNDSSRSLRKGLVTGTMSRRWTGRWNVNAGGQQTVAMVLGVHVGEVVFGQVVNGFP